MCAILYVTPVNSHISPFKVITKLALVSLMWDQGSLNRPHAKKGPMLGV